MRVLSVYRPHMKAILLGVAQLAEDLRHEPLHPAPTPIALLSRSPATFKTRILTSTIEVAVCNGRVGPPRDDAEARSREPATPPTRTVWQPEEL